MLNLPLRQKAGFFVVSTISLFRIICLRPSEETVRKKVGPYTLVYS
jgi:hypothetical protein